MNLMISQTASRLAPVAEQTDATADILVYATGECVLGQVLVARSISGVCAILIGTNHDEVKVDLAACFPQAKLVASDAVVHDDLAKLIRFVDKPTEGLPL